MKHFSTYIILLSFCLVMHSCQSPGGDTTGSEFMPDMAHSIAYEANVYNYYYNNTWGSEEDYYEYAKPKKPVEGTVPRGFSNSIAIPTANASKPYYYGDTVEERARATAEIIDNPLPITDAGLIQGKELYEIFCGICHGNKGDGLGYIYDVTEAYPIAPKRFIKGETGNDSLDMEMVYASNGRYYHAIMHGINLMGAYKDKLNHDERWNVIHYIRSLQAKGMDKEYNQTSNTLNNIDRPAGNNYVAERTMSTVEGGHSDEGIDHSDHQHDKHSENHSGEHSGDNSHSEGHDDSHDAEGGHEHSNKKHN